jgi:hypothetical protein
MDSKDENKRIADICFMLYEREVEARKKEEQDFLKLSKDEKKIYLAEKKYIEKIRKKEEKQIYNSKHYKDNLE